MILALANRTTQLKFEQPMGRRYLKTRAYDSSLPSPFQDGPVPALDIFTAEECADRALMLSRCGAAAQTLSAAMKPGVAYLLRDYSRVNLTRAELNRTSDGSYRFVGGKLILWFGGDPAMADFLPYLLRRRLLEVSEYYSSGGDAFPGICLIVDNLPMPATMDGMTAEETLIEYRAQSEGEILKYKKSYPIFKA